MSTLSLSWYRWDNFEFDLRISKDNQNLCTLMFSIFLLEIQLGLGHLYPDLPIQNSFQLDSVDKKIDSKDAVNEVLGLPEK